MATTLKRRFEEIYRAERELVFHRNKLDFLQAQPDELEVGSKFYRFATFTAVSGSAVSEQVANYSATTRHDVRGVANKGAKGTSKLPMANERALLKQAKLDPDVPKGMIRQYFCYANARGRGVIAEKIEIPSKFKEFAKIKRVKVPNQEMLHFQLYDTTSLRNYVVSLAGDLESAISRSRGSIEKTLRRNQRFQDVRINSGFTVVGGPEAIFQSATMLESRGGFLVQLGNEETAIMYCPDCASQALEAYSSSPGGTVSGIVFPPIPEIAMSSEVLCTENVHRDHSIADCFTIDRIESEIATIRRESGLDEFVIFNITIPSTNLSSTHGEWVWMGI